MTDPTTVEIVQRRGGRHYRLTSGAESVELPSVTTLTGLLGMGFLTSWASQQERSYVLDQAADLYARAHGEGLDRDAFRRTVEASLGPRKHQQIVGAAARIGTEAHSGIERFNRIRATLPVGPKATISAEAAWAVQCFEEWARDQRLTPELIERVVWSADFGFAGTLDLVARVGDKRLLVDMKTSNRVSDDHLLQAAFYQVALRESTGLTVDGALVLQLPKVPGKGAAREHLVPPLDDLWPACEALLHIWRWRHPPDD